MCIAPPLCIHNDIDEVSGDFPVGPEVTKLGSLNMNAKSFSYKKKTVSVMAGLKKRNPAGRLSDLEILTFPSIYFFRPLYIYIKWIKFNHYVTLIFMIILNTMTKSFKKASIIGWCNIY